MKTPSIYPDFKKILTPGGGAAQGVRLTILSGVLSLTACDSNESSVTPDQVVLADKTPSVYRGLIGFSAEQEGYIAALQGSETSSEARADALWNLAMSDCVMGGELTEQIVPIVKYLLFNEADSAVLFRLFDVALKCQYGMLASSSEYETFLKKADFSLREKTIQFMGAIGTEASDAVLLKVIKNEGENLCLRVLAGQLIKGNSEEILQAVIEVNKKADDLKMVSEAAQEIGYCPDRPE